MLDLESKEATDRTEILRGPDTISCGLLKTDTETGRVTSLHVQIGDELPTKRSAGFNKRSRIVSNLVHTRAQREWYLRLAAIGDARKYLWCLQRQCAMSGHKMQLRVIVRRRRLMRDYKNLVVAFDELILDGLVRHGVLYDDNMGNLTWEIIQYKVEAEEPPQVFMWWLPDQDNPCAPAIHKRAQKEASIMFEIARHRRIPVSNSVAGGVAYAQFWPIWFTDLHRIRGK